jgi:hypothetical protein
LEGPLEIFCFLCRSEIQDIVFNFLWNNKVDKVKRNTVIGNYEDGGLKMPHVLSFVAQCEKKTG